MWDEGFAVVPTRGKTPIVSGFNKWKRGPGPKAVAGWAKDYPDADIGYIPGLCRAAHGDPVIVVDGDDSEAVDEIRERFGPTPGIIRTRRGAHMLYRDVGFNLRGISSLKQFGLNADLKHGRSLAIAPPSRHPTDREFTYCWHGCDPSVIDHLPVFDVGALRSLMDARKPGESQGHEPCPNATSLPPSRPRVDLVGESRGLTLNRYLVSQAWACDTLDDMLDLAETFNAGFPDLGYEPLPEHEVAARAGQVWKDLKSGKIERLHGKRATCRTDADEVRHLAAAARNGSDAHLLLTLLRCEHGGRNRRGQAFAINANAMSEARTLGDWSPARIRAARDVLLKEGCIEVTRAGTSHRGGVCRRCIDSSTAS
jgi:hypothetical protein